MVNKTIKSINKMGKAGTIISLILRIFLIIGAVGCVIGMIALFVIPKDLVTVNVNGTAQIEINLESFGVDFSHNQEWFEERLNSGSFRINGSDMTVIDTEYEGSLITVNTAGKLMRFDTHIFAYAVLIGLLYIALSFVTLLFAGKLCEAFRDCASPFEDNVIRRLKAFAYSLLGWAVIPGVAGAIVSSLMISNYNFNLSFNMGTVFVVLILLALAYIFQYGAMLQKESNETL
ncbi:MAG: hypothetical protein WCY62_09525 [Clostridia bacterium]|jgi:hypothetical protein